MTRKERARRAGPVWFTIGCRRLPFISIAELERVLTLPGPLRSVWLEAERASRSREKRPARKD